AKHQQRFFVGDLAVIKSHVVQHRTIQLQDVNPAVVVVVQELGRNPAQQPRLGADSGAVSVIGKGSIAVVQVQPVQFKIQMGDVHVQQTVAIYIGGIDAHSCLVLA